MVFRSRILLLVALLATGASVAAFAGAEAVDGRPGDEATREMAWNGGERLVVAVPADVRYVQAPGPGRVTVTGPRRKLPSLYVANGVVGDRAWRTGARLKVLVQAPGVSSFSVQGGDRLRIENYDQDVLHIHAQGWTQVEARGRAKSVRLDLQGFGWANLAALDTEDATVTLSSGRSAVIAPTRQAKLSGTGSVVLLTDPASVTGRLDGAGKLIRTATARTP